MYMNIPCKMRGSALVPVIENGIIQQKRRSSVFRSTRKRLFLCFILFLYAAMLLPAQSRRDYIFENGQLIGVKETDNICELLISEQTVSSAAATYTFNVSCINNTPVNPVSDQWWLTVNGISNGQVSYSVAHNADSTRSGTITVAGKTFNVTQQSCGSLAYRQYCENQYADCSGSPQHAACGEYCLAQIIPQNPMCHPANNACISMIIDCGFASYRSGYSLRVKRSLYDRSCALHGKLPRYVLFDAIRSVYG